MVLGVNLEHLSLFDFQTKKQNQLKNLNLFFPIFFCLFCFGCGGKKNEEKKNLIFHGGRVTVVVGVGTRSRIGALVRFCDQLHELVHRAKLDNA